MKRQTFKPLLAALLVAMLVGSLVLATAAAGASPEKGIDKQTIERLQPYLKHAKAEIRATTAAVLGEMCCKGAVEPLVEMMKNDSVPAVRIVAANALSKLKDCSLVPDIREQAERETNPTAKHVLTAIANELETGNALAAK